MKTAKEYFEQAIRDYEELARSSFISAATQNSALETIAGHKILLKTDIDEKLACEGIQDLYSEAKHLAKLYPKLCQENRSALDRFDDAHTFVLKALGSFRVRDGKKITEHIDVKLEL